MRVEPVVGGLVSRGTGIARHGPLPRRLRQFPLSTIRVLEGHSDEVWFVCYSHDGRKLVTTSKVRAARRRLPRACPRALRRPGCAQDKTAIVWGVDDADARHVLSGHDDAVSFAAWSPDDSTIVTCSNDCTARAWDASTGRARFVLDKHKKSVRVHASAACAQRGDSAERSLLLAAQVSSCAWMPNGRSFVTGGMDHYIHEWGPTGDLMRTWSACA